MLSKILHAIVFPSARHLAYDSSDDITHKGAFASVADTISSDPAHRISNSMLILLSRLTPQLTKLRPSGTSPTHSCSRPVGSPIPIPTSPYVTNTLQAILLSAMAARNFRYLLLHSAAFPVAPHVDNIHIIAPPAATILF